MAVKRKTENDIDNVLEGQIPEAAGTVNMSEEEHQKMEDEIRARVEAEIKRREEEANKEAQRPVDTRGMVGQKLTHQFGGKDEYTSEQLKQKTEGKHLSQLGDNILANIEVREGWMHVDKALLGERAYFYPESWEFYIKPANVDAIRNWSTVNEENPINVSDVLNEILKYCLSIKTPNGPQPWSAINVWDKISFVLLIREYTFQSGEQNIQITEDCVNCDSPVTFILDSQSLMFDLPSQDVLRHYDRNTREWHIDPREYEIDFDPIVLYNPTLDKDINIQAWLINKYQENKNYKPEANFIKFLIWLAPKISKDLNIAKTQIKNYQMKYKSWDLEMFTFMEEVLRNITVTPSTNISAICPSCGEEVTTQIRFPNGIGELFNVRRKNKRFGSK